MNKKQYEDLKNQAWFQRIDDKFGEDLQNECIDYIEKLLLDVKNKLEV